jgi:hypothetical protein
MKINRASGSTHRPQRHGRNSDKLELCDDDLLELKSLDHSFKPVYPRHSAHSLISLLNLFTRS